MVKQVYSIEIEIAPGIIQRKIMRGPKTIEDAEKIVRHQQTLVCEGTGQTFLPQGKTTVSIRDPKKPLPRFPLEGKQGLIIDKREKRFDV